MLSAQLIPAINNANPTRCQWETLKFLLILKVFWSLQRSGFQRLD